MTAAIVLTAALATASPTPGPGLNDAVRMTQAVQWNAVVHWNATVQWNETARVRRETRAMAAPAAPTSRLASIRQCESGGDYAAVSSNGMYRGAYQFDRQTWASVGGSGDPAAASPAEQDARAQQLYNQAGATPWPVCGR